MAVMNHGHAKSGTQLAYGAAPDPDQYFDWAAARISSTPEKRLLFAVLLNAVTCLQRGTARSEAVEAIRWVRGLEQDARWPCSFQNICEALDLDPGHLSRGLIASFEAAGDGTLRVPRRQPRFSQPRGMYLNQKRGRPRKSETRTAARAQTSGGAPA